MIGRSPLTLLWISAATLACSAAPAVVPPLAPGRHRLRIDLFDEGHAWFYQVGSNPLEQELIVRE